MNDNTESYPHISDLNPTARRSNSCAACHSRCILHSSKERHKQTIARPVLHAMEHEEPELICEPQVPWFPFETEPVNAAHGEATNRQSYTTNSQLYVCKFGCHRRHQTST